MEKRVLLMLGEVIGSLERDEFSRGLLRALREAVPSDFSAINELPADLPHTISLTDPPVSPAVHRAFARYASQNPIADYFLRTRDGRATRFSDLVTRRELHRLDVYREVYQPLAVEYQIAFTLPSGAERILGVSLSRRKRDFSAAERDLLNLARPYLIQAYRNALAHTDLMRVSQTGVSVAALQPLGLTERQTEVLRLVAMGYSSEHAASALEIGARTVQKHLEHCYRTLNVTSRSEASRVAWAAVRGAAGNRGTPSGEARPAARALPKRPSRSAQPRPANPAL
jgi:DNA-binding CsgD family transcriptional regulator